jgi:transcriptional regulator with XRE-family HTH domain
MARVRTRQTGGKCGENKALVQVRSAAKKTQREFAKAVGINVSTLQKIEDGDSRLTLEQALRVMVFAGVDAASLMGGKKAKGLNQRPYTSKTFELWRDRPVDERAVALAAERIGLFASSLVRASITGAAKHGNPARFRVVAAKLWEALRKVCLEHGLGDLLEEELRGRAKEESLSVSLSRLKEILFIEGNTTDVRGWNHDEAAQTPSVRIVRGVQIQTPSFHPALVATNAKGEPLVFDAVAVDRKLLRLKLPWGNGRLTEFKLLSYKGYLAHTDGSISFEVDVIETGLA